MIKRVGTLLALVLALTGCYAMRYELEDDSLGTPNRTLAPIIPNAVMFPRLRAISLNTLPPIQPKVVGPPCSMGATIAVPAGGSVTFTSPTPPIKELRAPNQLCGWQFKTVSGSTFILTCQSFSLSGQDSLNVYEYRSFRPLFYRFRSQSFPTRLLLKATTVRVLLQYNQSGQKGYFSCTITASGGTTSPTTTSPTTTSPTTTSPTTTSPTTTSPTTTSPTTTSPTTTSPTTTSPTTTSPTTTSPTTTTTTTTPSTSSSSITTSTATQPTTEKIKAVARGPCRCGIVNRTTRIVGGTSTQVNEYPWQVGLMYKTNRGIFCGGTLFNDRFIVTAAHCMKGRTISTFRVLLGGHTMNSPSATERIVNPLSIINHPQYNVGISNNNDVALIKIKPLKFSSSSLKARPICMPNSPDTYAGVMATTTGWGTLSVGGAQPNILQEVNMPIVTNAYCTAVYGSAAINNNMICAGTAAGGKDSCQGDSGGPLIAPDGANYELIGVVSFGAGCGNPGVPGVYTRITAMQSWMWSKLSGTTCGR